MLISGSIDQLARKLGEILLNHKLKITTAESCTGGWLSQAITSVPGSSNWIDRAYVTYSNKAKHDMLDVDQKILDEKGAVSQEVVKQMAFHSLKKSNANISVAISGIAGPDGGSDEKPVGTVWLAIAVRSNDKDLEYVDFATKLLHLKGDRAIIRHQAVQHALSSVIEIFEK